MANNLRPRPPHRGDPAQPARGIPLENQSSLIDSISGAADAQGRTLPASLLRHRPRLSAEGSVLDNIAKVIGAGAALRLCAHFGGSRLYVAVNPAPNNPVASAIGYSRAVRLSSYFGGERIAIPCESAQTNRLRIARMRGRGKAVSQIARKLGCSERYVYKVMAQSR